jgi:hypothetical protein
MVEGPPNHPPPPPPPIPLPYGEFPTGDPRGGRRIQDLAIAAFVLSLLWIGGLGSLLAVIAGCVALYQYSSSQRASGRVLATAGVLLGLIGLAGSAFLYSDIGAGPQSTATQPPLRALNVAVTERVLLEGTLRTSDFPSTWGTEDGSSPIVGGIPLPDPRAAVFIAGAFGTCTHSSRALLDSSGSGPRVESPLFASTAANEIAQELVAAEEDGNSSGLLFASLKGPRVSTCVVDHLNSSWAHVYNQSFSGLNGLSDPSVSMVPSTPLYEAFERSHLPSPFQPLSNRCTRSTGTKTSCLSSKVKSTQC